MDSVRVLRTRPEAADLPLPEYATAGSAGLDLRACLAEGSGPLRLEPGGRAAVPTGLAIALPAGTEGQVRSRSGLALRHGVICLNSPGTIDADYRGEVRVILANFGPDPFDVHHGDRVAQLVVAPVVQVELQPVDSLDDTDRGAGGFGSTGSA